MNKDTQLTQKTFFVPDIYIDDGSGKVFHLAYKNANGIMTFDAWAGRVLPGQTAGEGISKELQDTLRYKGEFEIASSQEIQSVPDNKGNMTPRYFVSLVLSSQVESGLNIFGSQTVLHEISTLEVPNSVTVAEALKDAVINDVLRRYELQNESYRSLADVFSALDEVAHNWLINDLVLACEQDLKEEDRAKRNAAIHANEVKAEIHRIELKMQELNPNYKPTILEPMQIKDWNPPPNASIEEFYKEYAYYFGEEESKIDEVVSVYCKFHPEQDSASVKQAMLSL